MSYKKKLRLMFLENRTSLSKALEPNQRGPIKVDDKN